MDCQGAAGNWRVAWPSVSNMRKPLLRSVLYLTQHRSPLTALCSKCTQVTDIIVSSLLVDGTPVPRKVARLHLICDILHNSAAPLPMAWKFRQEFQARLGLVFDHLSTIYHSFPGRITAETFKNQIIAVVDIWDDWIVFPPDFTGELRERLEGMTKKADDDTQMEEAPVVEQKDVAATFKMKFKASTFRPAEESSLPVASSEDMGDAMDVSSDEDVDGVPVNDVDGDPLAEDVDGDPLDDVDGEPVMEDVDGLPMGADLDGEPMGDVDVDGEPMGVIDVDGELTDDGELAIV